MPIPEFPPRPFGPGSRGWRLFEATERYVRIYFRHALALIFVWFGALKVMDASPIADLVSVVTPFLPASISVPALGWWEILTGVGFLFRRTVPWALVMMLIQLPGTFLPFFVVPEVCFTGNPFFLTLEGEFIVKNVLLLGAALVVGSTLHPSHQPVSAPEILK